MSEYKAAPTNGDEESSVQSWRPPTPPLEEEKPKSWFSGIKKKIKNITDKEEGSNVNDLRKGNIESTASALSVIGFGYDESLLMETEEPSGSFLKPSEKFVRNEYQPPSSCNQSEHYNENTLENSQQIAEEVRDQCSLFYSGVDEEVLKNAKNFGDRRFRLDQNDPVVEDKEAWPCVSEISSAGIQADFRRSSLYQLIEGRVQLYLPTDNVRLMMDPLLEPGLLLLVKDNGPITNTPSYVLTVDEHLYRRLVKEMAARNRACGLYFCCHESTNKVNIGVAVTILVFSFTAIFITTLIWPH